MEQAFHERAGAGPLLANEKRLVAEARDCDRFAGQRMIPGGDNNVRMLAKLGALKIEVLGRPAHNRQIEGQIPERGDGLAPVMHGQPQIDAGMPQPECGQSLGREIFRRAHHARCNDAALDTLELGDFLVAFGQQGFDPVRRLEQDLARAGRCCAFTQALDERQASRLLKLLHLHGNRGRCNMQLARGAGHRARLCHGREDAKLP